MENFCDSGVTLYGGAFFVSMLSHVSHVSHQVYVPKLIPQLKHGGVVAQRYCVQFVHGLSKVRFLTRNSLVPLRAWAVLDFLSCCAVSITNDQD